MGTKVQQILVLKNKCERNNSATNTSQAQQAVKNLAPGQTIQGEIIDERTVMKYRLVDKDVVITAKLDRDIPVSVGQNMTLR